MKDTKKTFSFKSLLFTISFLILFLSVKGQEKKTIVFDDFHGQNPKNGKVFNSLLPDSLSVIEIDSLEINDRVLEGKFGLIIFSPTKAFQDSEKQAIIAFIKSGGSLLLIFDEERRTPLNGINDIISPFGIELTDDTPYLHNCGAIAEKNEVCAERRELPYSGGRSIKGGNIISKVYMEGDYVHCAYVSTNRNGKIIVMSDGMAGLLYFMGTDGIRLTGTKPSDTKYWGKDSKIFMEEILIFLTK